MSFRKYISAFLALCFGLALGWGILLRAAPIPNISLWMDEGISFLASRTLLETGGIILPGGTEYGFFSIAFHSIVAFSLVIFGENEWGFRIPSLLFSVLLPLAAFFAFRKHFPKKIFLAPLLFCALLFSSWEIIWASQGRMYSMLSLFFCGALFFAFYFFQERNIRSLIATGIFTLVAIFTHPFAFSLLPLFLIGVLIFSGREIFRFQNLALFATLLLLILFFFSNFIAGLLTEAHNHSSFYIRWLWDFHATTLLLFFLGILLVLFRGSPEEKKLVTFFSSSIFLVLLALFFVVPLVNYRYLFPLFPLVVSVIFLGISCIPKKWFLTASLLTLSFFVAEGQILPKKNILLESDLQKYEGYRVFTPQADFRSGFDFIQKNQKKDDIVLTSAPEIALFYNVSIDAVLPFDFEKQVDWDFITRPKYVDLPYFSSLLEVHTFIQNRHGWILFDEYARQKMPSEVFAYLETNTERVFEKSENPDSIIFVYHF